MSTKHLVCQGAICKCQFGELPDTLKVLTHKKHFINDKDAKEKLVATTADTGMTFEKNTFGQCKLQPMGPGSFKPCQPVLQQWTGHYEKIKYEINSGNPLLEDSKGICAISGSPCIEIIFHGQTAEPTQKNIDNTRDEVLTELMPFVDIKENEDVDNHLPIE